MPSYVCFSFRYGGGLYFGMLIDGVTKRFSTEFEYKQVCFTTLLDNLLEIINDD